MHTTPLAHTASKYYYAGMFRKSILSLTALLAVILAQEGNAGISSILTDNDGYEHMILLFGASWCAPCVGEIRNISELSTAAKPDRLVIVWSDSSIRRYQVPHYDNVEIASASQAHRLIDLYASESAGLPYAVMIDKRGHRCAEWRAPLSPKAVAQLRATCNLPPAHA